MESWVIGERWDEWTSALMGRWIGKEKLIKVLMKG